MLKILLTTALLVTVAFSQDDEESNIFENIDFEYTAYANSFNTNVIDGEKYSRYELWNKLNIRNKIDVTDNIQLTTDVVAMFSNNRNNYNGILTGANDSEQTIRYIDISKLYLTYFLDDMDIYLGKKSKKIGLSEIYNPTDIFSKNVLPSPQHPVEMGDFTLGVDYYIEDDTLSFNIFPTTTSYGMPDIASRWLQGSGDLSFFGGSGGSSLPAGAVIENEKNDSNLRNWGFLLQYAGMIEGIDYYTYVSRKKSNFPVLIQDSLSKYTKIYPMSTYLAAGFLKVHKENKFYMDIVYQNTEDDFDQDFIKYNIGAKHRQSEYASEVGLDEIAIIAELSKEIIVNKDLSNSVYQNSEDSRVNKNNLTLSAHFIKDSQLSYMYTINYSINNYDSFQNHTVKYNRTDNQTFYLSYYSYDGVDGTNFGRWKDNDNIEIGVEYKF
ncbi:hypothetical protein N9A28_00630 [Sulfurimonas sp.]|nr:hypothetical protein [Sulfurimonas sp.]